MSERTHELKPTRKIYATEVTYQVLREARRKEGKSMLRILEERVVGRSTPTEETPTPPAKPRRPRPPKGPAKVKPPHPDLPDLIKLFECVNPAVHLLYGNKTERASGERLLERWSLAQLSQVIQVLPRLNEDKFSKGKSTTPSQLERNLGFVMAWVRQQHGSSPQVSFN